MAGRSGGGWAPGRDWLATDRWVALAESLPRAVEFLTPLRIGSARVVEDRRFGMVAAWFPLVGLGLGAVLLLMDRALDDLFLPGPTSALLLAALALLSGGLHLDGVADTADGLAVRGDRATRLGVMSEGATGAAGAAALALVLLVQWSALVSLGPPLRDAGLLLLPALSRGAVIPLALAFSPARPRGIGHALQQGVWPEAAAVATVTAFGASVLLFGPGGLLLPPIAGAAAWLVGWAASRVLGGITGDTFGAGIEFAQAAVLLALVAAAQHDWLEPTFLG